MWVLSSTANGIYSHSLIDENETSLQNRSGMHLLKTHLTIFCTWHPCFSQEKPSNILRRKRTITQLLPRFFLV